MQKQRTKKANAKPELHEAPAFLLAIFCRGCLVDRRVL